MAKPLTRGAIVGVIFMIVAFCLCIISIGAPFWFRVKIEGVEDPTRKLPQEISAHLNNAITARYGLWELCAKNFNWADASIPWPTVITGPDKFIWDLHSKDECKNLVVESWDFFRGTQAMMLIALLLIIGSIVCAFLYCLARESDIFIILFSVLGVSAAVFVMIAAVIFGLSAPGHILADYNYPQEVYNQLELVRLRHFTTGSFEWGYGIGVTSGILALLGSVFATVQWEIHIFRKVYADDAITMSGKKPATSPTSNTPPAESTSV